MTREDPSGLWSFAGLGAKIGSYFGSAGARIGASLGSIVDYGIGYATGWGGGGGYNRYGYSGGGYGFSGNTAGRKAKQAVKAAAPVAPPEPAWKRNGPSAHLNTPLSVSLGTKGAPTPSLTGPMAKANDPYGNIKRLPPNNEEYLANESACPRTGLDLIGLGSYAGGPVVGTMVDRSALAVNMALDGYFYGKNRRNGEGGGFDFWSSVAWSLVGVQSWIPGADVVPGIINTAEHSYGCLAN